MGEIGAAGVRGWGNGGRGGPWWEGGAMVGGWGHGELIDLYGKKYA